MHVVKKKNAQWKVCYDDNAHVKQRLFRSGCVETSKLLQPQQKFQSLPAKSPMTSWEMLLHSTWGLCHTFVFVICCWWQRPSLSATENKAPLPACACAFNDDDHRCGSGARKRVNMSTRRLKRRKSHFRFSLSTNHESTDACVSEIEGWAKGSHQPVISEIDPISRHEAED